jgi:hypothetical protein
MACTDVKTPAAEAVRAGERFDAAERPSVTPDVLFRVLDFRDGQFFFREMIPELLPDDRCRKRWNTLYSGKPATVSAHCGGYRTISFCKRSFLVHRLVWLFTYGAWPNGHIDHLNGDRADNRIENLREASDTENMRNQKLRTDSSSGFAGVSYSRERGKWRAYVLGRHIGYFETFEEAARARVSAQGGLGFTERHGRPAPARFPYAHRTVAEVWEREVQLSVRQQGQRT